MKKIKIIVHRILVWFTKYTPSLAFYEASGVHFCEKGQPSYKKPRIKRFTLIGDYSNLYLHNNCDINEDCFLVAKAKIEIGENSTLAYRASIHTSAYPHGNLLTKLYPKKIAPVTIKDNVWVGANATILPGVTVGRCSVIAAGSLVNKDIPPYVVVAGVPAKIIKSLDFKLFE